ncbi:MAG: TetR/AcrR family transcriptional regulator [Spirochaetota bacterium]
MPKKPRSKKELDNCKKDILTHALDLIQEEGYEGFSMRKLSSRLNVSVVSLYRIYESKDHIYLDVLTKGFQLLYKECRKAFESKGLPEERLKSMATAYLRFGIEQANFYNLMFTWHVPKYQDYVGTPMEETAQYELLESQKVYFFAIQATKEIAETIGIVTDYQIRSYFIYFWSTLHGYISSMNNHLLHYMHEDPLSLKQSVVENLFSYLKILIEENRDIKHE